MSESSLKMSLLRLYPVYNELLSQISSITRSVVSLNGLQEAKIALAAAIEKYTANQTDSAKSALVLTSITNLLKAEKLVIKGGPLAVNTIYYITDTEMMVTPYGVNGDVIGIIPSPALTTGFTIKIDGITYVTDGSANPFHLVNVDGSWLMADETILLPMGGISGKSHAGGYFFQGLMTQYVSANLDGEADWVFTNQEAGEVFSIVSQSHDGALDECYAHLDPCYKFGISFEATNKTYTSIINGVKPMKSTGLFGLGIVSVKTDGSVVTGSYISQVTEAGAVPTKTTLSNARSIAASEHRKTVAVLGTMLRVGSYTKITANTSDMLWKTNSDISSGTVYVDGSYVYVIDGKTVTVTDDTAAVVHVEELAIAPTEVFSVAEGLIMNVGGYLHLYNTTQGLSILKARSVSGSVTIFKEMNNFIIFKDNSGIRILKKLTNAEGLVTWHDIQYYLPMEAADPSSLIFDVVDDIVYACDGHRLFALGIVDNNYAVYFEQLSDTTYVNNPETIGHVRNDDWAMLFFMKSDTTFETYRIIHNKARRTVALVNV